MTDAYAAGAPARGALLAEGRCCVEIITMILYNCCLSGYIIACMLHLIISLELLTLFILNHLLHRLNHLLRKLKHFLSSMYN